MKKKIFFSTVVLLLAANRASAQDAAWLLEDGVTPQALSSDGALLTGTDSMAWSDGRSVFVTYWLGTNDAVFRCAELRDGEASSPSCWRREIVAESVAGAGMTVVRRIATRRRPLPVYDYQQPYAFHPHLWIGAFR